MGVHKEPQIPQYWNQNIDLGLLHTISFYITLCRFKQIKRYLYVSDIEDDIQQGRDRTNEW
jgi:hypothetical protein